eukprot:346009-Prymnesium_polylepis.1
MAAAALTPPLTPPHLSLSSRYGDAFYWPSSVNVSSCPPQCQWGGKNCGLSAEIVEKNYWTDAQ